MSPTSAIHAETFDDFQPATRIQAKRGGGPKTDQGKARSSENRTSHGCCSNRLILPGEDPEEYAQIKEGWFSDYDPIVFACHALTLQVVNMHWFLLRTQRRVDDVELSLSEKSPLEWTDQDHRQLTNFLRYRTAAERSFQKSFAALEKHRSTRVRERQSEERLHLKRENTRSIIEARLRKAMVAANDPMTTQKTAAMAPEPPPAVAQVPRPVVQSAEFVGHPAGSVGRHAVADMLESSPACPIPITSHQPFSR